LTVGWQRIDRAGSSCAELTGTHRPGQERKLATRLAGIIPLAALPLLVACGRREAAPAGRPGARAAAPQAVSAIDVTAYRLGRSREIVLTEAALRLLRCAGSVDEHAVVAAAADADRIEADGARAAGLATDQYEQLVARMDSLLIARARERGAAGGDSPRAAGLETLAADVAGLLDSLRVELVVARERLVAETAQPFRPGRAAGRSAC
jgi:hypothetical protein